MTVASSVADVLDDHTVFEIESLDRMYLNVFRAAAAVCRGAGRGRAPAAGLSIASTKPLGKISDRFTTDIRCYARDHRVPMVDFVRGQRKDDVMHSYLASFTAAEGCCS